MTTGHRHGSGVAGQRWAWFIGAWWCPVRRDSSGYGKAALLNSPRFIATFRISDIFMGVWA